MGEAAAAGTPCWVVMATPEAEASTGFYRGLFGWEAAGGDGGFVSLRTGGRDVAGLFPLPEEARASGAASRWLVYLASDDVGAHLDRVRPAGGTILAPAFDVPGAGRMAMVADATGAEFGLWESRGHPGAAVTGEPASLTWTELYTRSRAAATHFYEAVFGWLIEEVRSGTESFITCSLDGRPVAGMMAMSAAWGPTPSHWMPYFAVTDVDQAAALADGLGGEVVSDPRTTRAGRLAVLRDPFGALFFVVAPPAG